MTIQDFAVWSQIISSVAILGTLIYLAIETKQNSETLNAQIREALFTGSQTEILQLLDHPELVKSISSEKPLSENEYIKLSAFLTSFMRAREFAWLQYKSGIIDKNSFNTEIIIIKNTLLLKRTHSWWKEIGKGAFSPSFVAFVDSILIEGEVVGEWFIKSLNWES